MIDVVLWVAAASMVLLAVGILVRAALAKRRQKQRVIDMYSRLASEPPRSSPRPRTARMGSPSPDRSPPRSHLATPDTSAVVTPGLSSLSSDSTSSEDFRGGGGQFGGAGASGGWPDAGPSASPASSESGGGGSGNCD